MRTKSDIDKAYKPNGITDNRTKTTDNYRKGECSLGNEALGFYLLDLCYKLKVDKAIQWITTKINTLTQTTE